jgi:two-component system nitrogen regulation response regulator GlnG
VPIHIPPLRERPEDVPVLAEHFVRRYAEELGLGARHLSPQALERLRGHPWPGNVRELENAIRRALVLSTAEVLSAEDFDFLEAAPEVEPAGPALEAAVAEAAARALAEGEPGDLHRRIFERVERPLLEAVLAHTGGNQIRAAALLGINRNTLRKRIGELGLEVRGRA